ncbi:Lipase (class 2) [Burkholderiales bacterium JOSHI_001]|nr:Lipase (class 2) [Burkholderiales bacterium JOSHI_001]
MFTTKKSARRLAATLFTLALAAAGAAQAAGTVGSTLPAAFATVQDASLGATVLGFGAAGKAVRTPVIFLHGNGGTPFESSCGSHIGPNLQAMAQFFADSGYTPSELWGLAWQGDQCDLVSATANASSLAHSITANVADLRQFVAAVLASTGASKVDIVAYGEGVVLAREWVRQDSAVRKVRRLVAIDGTNHGTLMCSPASGNYWQNAFVGGFTPNSPYCQELGSPSTPFLTLLNRTRMRISPSSTLVIRNGDASYPYMSVKDGMINPVPSIDAYGKAVDFSSSPSISGAYELVVTGQGSYDPLAGTAHVGIGNSPATWQAALNFLKR